MRSTYQAWANMRQRCGNKKRPDFDRYGGRGVQVCDRWQSFENFLADMGVKPSKLHSIDRIDFTKGYEPGNCRWADAMTQALNKSDIIVLEYKGERRPLTEWCRELDINPRMVRERLHSGWSIARALETPSRFAVTG